MRSAPARAARLRLLPVAMTSLAIACGAVDAHLLAAQSAQSPPSAVVGSVRDSLRGAPLAGATVQLVPATTPGAPGLVTSTDSAGRFRIDAVAPGRYLVGFVHPRLDALGLEPPTREVEVRPGAAEVRADLVVPGAAAFAAAVCGAPSGAISGAPGDSAGGLVGRVFDAGDAAPARGGAVVVRWGEVVADRQGVRRVVAERRGAVGAGGRCVVCGVPADGDVDVQALVPAPALGGDSAASGAVEVRVPAGVPVVERDLWVDGPGARAAGAPNAAVLAGRVRGPDGRPLAGARVAVRVGAPHAGLAPGDPVAVTDADGAYRLAGLPAGTRAVAVFALGYSPARAVADLRPGRVTTADLTAGPRVVTLEGVRVTGSPVNPASEYARHRRRGVGYFYDADEIARRGPYFVADALVGRPGLQVRNVRHGRPVVAGRSGCEPRIFVDGVRVPESDTSELDFYVSLSQIGAMEVYASGLEAPPQYTTASGNCAVILFWTKWALR